MANIELHFYNNKQDKRVVNKDQIELLYESYGFLKRPTDLCEPRFIIEKSLHDWDNMNYLYCPQLQRYYYINNKILGEGKQVELICEVDPLMSFKNYFLNNVEMIARQETNYASNSGVFYDNEYPVRAERKIRKKAIGQVTTDYGYYLTVNGGGL